MDWEFVVCHLISGGIPAAAGLALYFIVLYASGRKQTAAHIIASSCFCFYIIGILTVTGICFKGSFSPRIVIVPFADMIRGPVDTVLNVLLFIPAGIFLPLLYEKYDNLRIIAAAGFLASLSIETAQMFGSGISDINDLITNTAGACVGYGIYALLSRAVPQSWRKRMRLGGPRCYTEPLIFWAGSMILMTTVQVELFRAFFPAG